MSSAQRLTVSASAVASGWSGYVTGMLKSAGVSVSPMLTLVPADGGIINLPGIPGETWLVGLVLMVAIGLVIGTLPALRAMRLKIVDALAGR